MAAKDRPRYIKLNERDNVAIVVNDFGLPAGTRFDCGLTLREGCAVDIAEGAPVLRYGEVIGYAVSPILSGDWVDEARIRMRATWVARQITEHSPGTRLRAT